MQYMKHSFKPTLYTFIPIIIIFGWLNAHLAYLPITPGTEFMVSAEFKEGTFGEVSIDSLPELTFVSEQTQELLDGKASWTIMGEEGEYLLKITSESREYDADLLITTESKYANPIVPIKDSNLKQIVIHNEKVRPLGDISLFGWTPGWLGMYIILSLVFSFGIRKLLKIS